MSTRGMLIATLGVNNLGKSAQVELLVERLNREGITARKMKYALYHLLPSGPLLNGYLREKNPYGLSPREFQIIHVLNRTQGDAELRRILESGETVVVEDYVGTGIAWGIGEGVSEDFLTVLNSHLVPIDLGILFEGERFLEGREKGHRHEEDDALTNRVAEVHYELSLKHGWLTVDSNGSREEVHERVWQVVSRALFPAALS